MEKLEYMFLEFFLSRANRIFELGEIFRTSQCIKINVLNSWNFRKPISIWFSRIARYRYFIQLRISARSCCKAEKKTITSRAKGNAVSKGNNRRNGNSSVEPYLEKPRARNAGSGKWCALFLTNYVRLNDSLISKLSEKVRTILVIIYRNNIAF